MEPRLVLTADGFEQPLAFSSDSLGLGNVRIEAPVGMQLTLVTVVD
jgi:hypothetical protein